MVEFERNFTQFALLQKNKWIICVLDDKPTVHDQKLLISLTNSELVKIHVHQKHVMVKEIIRIPPTQTAIDEKILNRKNAFKAFKEENLNTPIPVKYTENITRVTVDSVKTTVFCNPEGQIYDMPVGMPSDEMATLAKVVKAEIVIAQFDVTTTLLEKASPHRSQSKI